MVWPVQRATLAALIDIGLSNAEIAAYFSVLPDDVHMLADRYGLIWQLPVASQSDLRIKSAASSMAEAMHQLADGLTAAITYANAAQRTKSDNALGPDLLGKTAGQLARVGKAYARLRIGLRANSGEVTDRRFSE